MERKFYVIAIYVNFGDGFIKNPQVQLIGAESEESAVEMTRQAFFEGKKQTVEIKIEVCGEAEIAGEYFGRKAEIIY